MATSVGLASSVTQSKAAQGKKQRQRASIPVTPEIKATVAKIRANNSGTKAELTETPPNHDDVRESWHETVTEMKLVIRDMRARVNQEAQTVAPEKPPVVFETFVQVVEETAPVFMVGLTSEPAPLPEKVVIVDVPLLPAVTETGVEAEIKRSGKERIERLAACNMPFRLFLSGDVITLPANAAPIAGLLPALTSHNRPTAEAVKKVADATAADERRAAVRAAHAVETGESAPKPAPMDVGRRSQWIDRDSKLFKVKVGG